MENLFRWLALEVSALCMPDDAHKSDILVAGGGNGTALNPQASVATGVGPGVGSPTALWLWPRTPSRGCL